MSSGPNGSVARTEGDPGHAQEIAASIVVGVALLVIVFLLYGADRLADDALEIVGVCSGAGFALTVVRVVVKPRGKAIGSAMFSLVAWGVIFHGGRNSPPPGLGANSLLLWSHGSPCPAGTPNAVPGALCWDLPHVALVSFVVAALLGVIAFLIQLGVPLIFLRLGRATIERMVAVAVAAALIVGPAIGFAVGELSSLVAGLLGSIGGVDVTVGLVGLLTALLDLLNGGQIFVQLALVLAILAAIALLLAWWRRRSKK